MKEYFGDSVKNYRQPKDKYIKLFPNLKKILEILNPDASKVLDLGCGDGILYSLFFSSSTAEYLGIDISEDMVAQAKIKNPTGNFIVGSASALPDVVSTNYDYVVSNMLFPSIGDKEVFRGIFKEASRVLKEGGYFIATIINPYFDGYMQKMLFNREDIVTEFKGYYESPVKYEVFRNIDGVDFTFTDYHWKLNDYLNAGNEVGLSLENIDECLPLEGKVVIEKEKFEKMFRFPNYLIMVFKKTNIN